MASNLLEDEMIPSGPHSDSNNADKLSILESSESGYAESVETDSFNPGSEIMATSERQVNLSTPNTDHLQTSDSVDNTFDSLADVTNDSKDINDSGYTKSEDANEACEDIVGENEEGNQVGETEVNPKENMNSSRQSSRKTPRSKNSEEPPPNEAVISKEKLPSFVSIEIIIELTKGLVGKIFFLLYLSFDVYTNWVLFRQGKAIECTP